MRINNNSKVQKAPAKRQSFRHTASFLESYIFTVAVLKALTVKFALTHFGNLHYVCCRDKKNKKAGGGRHNRPPTGASGHIHGVKASQIKRIDAHVGRQNCRCFIYDYNQNPKVICYYVVFHHHPDHIRHAVSHRAPLIVRELGLRGSIANTTLYTHHQVALHVCAHNVILH